MEVTVHSTLSNCPGQVLVATDSDQPVDSLITTFCVSKGVPLKKEYVLRNRNQELLDNTLKVGTCGIKNGDVLFLGLRSAAEQWLFGCNQWWLLAGVALLIGGAGLVAVSIMKVNGTLNPTEYGIVLDAGSTHTNLYIYKWPGEKENGTAVVTQIYKCRTEPGISSFTSNPPQAGTSLKECLDQAEKTVPASQHSKTPVYLGATAGMRLLNTSDISTCDAILKAVRDMIASYPFNFTDHQARILTGEEEGAFSWVTANYLAGNFGETKASKMTIGALDLGGASTQNTFIPEEPESVLPSYKKTLLLYGETYHTYTHSYLCYGSNEAFRQMKAHLVKDQNYNTTIQNPCGPKGNTSVESYGEIFDVPCTKEKKSFFLQQDVPENTTFEFVGTSNSAECAKAVGKVFNFTESCGQEPNCSFNGVYQPPVFGNFLAFSAFYTTVSFFNLTEDTGSFTLEQLRNKTLEFCSLSWDQIQYMPVSNPRYLVLYCFDAHYIDSLLTGGYKFTENNWKSITFKPDIDGTDLGWSVGYMLNSSNILPAEYPSEMIGDVVFGILVALFIIFLAIAIGFACYAKSSRAHKKKYQKLTDYGSV